MTLKKGMWGVCERPNLYLRPCWTVNLTAKLQFVYEFLHLTQTDHAHCWCQWVSKCISVLKCPYYTDLRKVATHSWRGGGEKTVKPAKAFLLFHQLARCHPFKHCLQRTFEDLFYLQKFNFSLLKSCTCPRLWCQPPFGESLCKGSIAWCADLPDEVELAQRACLGTDLDFVLKLTFLSVKVSEFISLKLS